MGENSAITSKNYLSLCIENIHKVIDPIFLDDLKAQLTKSNILENVNRSSKRKNFLLNLQKKLAEIKILDPACGSGNFLTESYISLRRLENLILQELLGNQITLGELDNPVKISIKNFFGIEILTAEKSTNRSIGIVIQNVRNLMEESKPKNIGSC